MGLAGFGFDFSENRSGFGSEQGVNAPNRNFSFGAIKPLFSQLQPTLQDIRTVRAPRFAVDEFGFLRNRTFNANLMIQRLLGNALAQTAAQGTARGQVNPENLVNFATQATRDLGAQFLPQAQQNVLAAETVPSNFELGRQLSIFNPILQSAVGTATGGGSSAGSSHGIALGGDVKFGPG